MLTAKSAEKVREIEQEHDVSIAVDRKAQAVKILGSKESAAKAKEAIEAALQEVSGDEKVIEIGWDDGKVVIGKGGNTVRHIKQTTGVDDLQVQDGENCKQVTLKGSAEAIEEAVKMIREVIAKAGEGRERTDAPKEGRPAKSEEKPKRSEESAPVKKSKPPAAKVNVQWENQELFPGLGNGDVVAKAPQATWGAKAAWKKDGDSAKANIDEAEAFPELDKK